MYEMNKDPHYTFKRYRRIVNANLKQETNVLNSGRISDGCRLKVQAERVRLLEWVKLWLDKINDTQKIN
jgi:hypothetical protein